MCPSDVMNTIILALGVLDIDKRLYIHVICKRIYLTCFGTPQLQDQPSSRSSSNFQPMRTNDFRVVIVSCNCGDDDGADGGVDDRFGWFLPLLADFEWYNFRNIL